MKKKLILLSFCFLSLSAFAQTENEAEQNIDWQEDSSEIVTVSDIINMQQAVTVQNNKEKHFADVWSYRTYLNLSSTKATFTPQEKIKTGVNSGLVEEFKSDWGASLTWGHNYPLHKHPIANVAQINLDYTWIDLNVNHVKIDGDGKNIYDSSKKFDKDTHASATSSSSNSAFYTPWNLEKYEANYGMSIGPSLTIAPFTYVNVPALHYVRFNVYYHVGYYASLILMSNNEEADVNQGLTGTAKDNHDKMADNSKIDWGHGMTTSIGFSVNWKFIGFGFETRKAKLKYTSLVPSEFGKDKYEFKTNLSRVYLQFRF